MRTSRTATWFTRANTRQHMTLLSYLLSISALGCSSADKPGPATPTDGGTTVTEPRPKTSVPRSRGKPEPSPPHVRRVPRASSPRSSSASSPRLRAMRSMRVAGLPRRCGNEQRRRPRSPRTSTAFDRPDSRKGSSTMICPCLFPAATVLQRRQELPRRDRKEHHLQRIDGADRGGHDQGRRRASVAGTDRRRGDLPRAFRSRAVSRRGRPGPARCARSLARTAGSCGPRRTSRSWRC